ncbi:shikimate kinase [Ruminococcaceae bacterium YRB3002]|nr:shikimate kinase [Ruminococcaceae bacterium YRB3002]
MFRHSIVIIGMPGSGKSTIGRMVADECRMEFVDTDELLVAHLGMSLQEYIDAKGSDAFAREEEKFICGMEPPAEPRVISTGGSVVLYPKAMEHLKMLGIVVFLDCSLPLLRKRLWNFESRGIVPGEGEDKEQALLDIYSRREPLYYKYADVRVDQSGKGRKTIVNMMIREVELYENRP